MKSSVFYNICNFAAFGQYFTVLWKIIVRKRWFVSTLQQNYPCASSFGGKRRIHSEFGRFLQFLIFWAILKVYFGRFLGSSMHPSYQNMNHVIKYHPGLEYKPTNILSIIFAFQALLLTKIYFWHFGGLKMAPLRPRDLKTSGYGV